MVRVHYGRHFIKNARKLPRKQQEKLASLIVLAKNNPFHPQLHSKPLGKDLAGMYSFRIAREYRVLFRFLSPDEVVLTDVGHRKDIYR